MSETFEQFTDKVIINAQFVAQDGQAEIFENALKEVQKYALSDKEPGCLTYRVCRSGNQFLVFEEYKNSAAIHEHRSTPPYQSLTSQAQGGTLIVPGSRKVIFYEEV
ncbi:hypothetical protein FS749_002278 [Ceratobasidium sp. UAMH 11750]|nr:hypothetical protein FS749_002278 [Ceratobasidium sp. UAMH 11750]